jgi:hypothetical protein
VLYSRAIRLFLTALALTLVGALAGSALDGAHTRRSPLAASVYDDAHAALEQAGSSHLGAEACLDVADEDSPDEELLFAAPGAALLRTFGSCLTLCPAQTLISRERHLTLERPPRA